MDSDECAEGVGRTSDGPLVSTNARGEADTGVTLDRENNLVHHGSDYMVPSQLAELDSDDEPVLPQGKDAKSDFMPVYETVCKFSNAAGAEGRQLLEQRLNTMRDKQLEIIAKKKEPSGDNHPYNEYMHLFENLCSHTNDAGEEGRQLLRSGLNSLKSEQVDILTREGKSLDGMASMPATSTKTVDKRITSRSSPKKRKR